MSDTEKVLSRLRKQYDDVTKKNNQLRHESAQLKREAEKKHDEATALYEQGREIYAAIHALEAVEKRQPASTVQMKVP